MQNKYIHAKELVYRVIANYVEIGICPDDIAAMMVKEYRLEIEYFYVKKENIIDYYRGLAEQAWYCRYGHHNYKRSEPYERTRIDSADNPGAKPGSFRAADNAAAVPETGTGKDTVFDFAG